MNLSLEAEDYSAAVTFARTLSPVVDPSRVVLWGIGHSGGAAATAAAMDSRIKGAMLVIPSLSDVGRFPQDLVNKMWEQRSLDQEKVKLLSHYLIDLLSQNSESVSKTD